MRRCYLNHHIRNVVVEIQLFLQAGDVFAVIPLWGWGHGNGKKQNAVNMAGVDRAWWLPGPSGLPGGITLFHDAQGGDVVTGLGKGDGCFEIFKKTNDVLSEEKIFHGYIFLM